ncbi:hypothetical protein BGY98DRAFT_1093710 [Russula aff. rugulosa BPL654]|nr:hypothetical protein BGY98DRAFT_1093710 [Russula aff. rugulosa BPL654]
MPLSSRKKKHSLPPSTSPVPTNELALLASSQENQQPQPVCPWFAHSPTFGPFGRSQSPFLRHFHTLSTSTTAGELFLFGGYVHSSRLRSDDLYVISTRDFSTKRLQTSGDDPSPRYGHRAVLTSTTLLIWGGMTFQYGQYQSDDDSFYMFDLASREWTRIVVNGPGPGSRYYHTMTLVGSKLFVFGGKSANRCFNDVWALDLDCLKSNPFWESYEPAPGSEKPLPRARHVSVTTGDRIIIFGGCGGPHIFNDTWSFNISTRKWTEFQCTGSIPSPRESHAAVLIDDVMYVYGGRTIGKTKLGDLTAFNLLTQRWTAFQDIGPSPSGRSGHAMASDGRRVFVLGGALSADAQENEAKLIHVLDTNLLIYPKPDSDTVKHSEKTTRLARRLSAGRPTQGQPQHQISSSSDAGTARGAFKITRGRNPSLDGLPSQSTGVDGLPRCVPQEDDDSESSTEHVAPEFSSEEEGFRLENERVIELERQLLAMRAAQSERDRRITLLTDQLIQKDALLEQAEANAVEARKRTLLEQRALQVKLDEFLLSRDQALEQAQSALQNATFRAAEAKEQSRRELAEVHAKLEARESELAAVRLRVTDAEDGSAKRKAETGISRVGTQAVAGILSADVDRVMWRLMERVRVVEAEMASLRGNEKSIEAMECRNEG